MPGDVFDKEQQLIDRCDVALSGSDEWPLEVREIFEELLKAHTKQIKTSRRLVRLSDRLQEEARSSKSELQKLYEERGRHAETLETTVSERTEELRNHQRRLEKLIDVGVSLTAERSLNAVLEIMLLAAKELTNADGATIYLVEDETRLQFALMRNDTLGIVYSHNDGETEDEEDFLFPPLPLFSESGAPNRDNLATDVYFAGETTIIDDIYAFDDEVLDGPRHFDKNTGYQSKSFLTTPLRTPRNEIVGVLQLVNAIESNSEAIVPFDVDLVTAIEALSSQAAVAINNQQLIAGQQKLMDAFIQLISGAIDSKSPYTGGHCQRVPVLAEMLAEEAHRSNNGSFQDFAMSEDDWHEFRIAAWLHDCGKVTTPEYVVDKATKLETIYNRIHEIRTRFEVLIRDAEISYWQARIEAGAEETDLRAERDAKIAKLHEEFAFVATCNVGGEFMDDADIERLADIAQRKWLRHFDDRLGLSKDELSRKGVSTPVTLPAAEQLLDDRSDHIIPREGGSEILGDNPFGFRMDVPEHSFNLGEVHNLSIRRGTLTDEERFKINDHIIQTIAMLNQLPFPKNLARVPEIAGNHHETMIGTGYPRKLIKEEMSIPSRIMAIADIFEALTAADRPYKDAKTLSQSLRIMSFMRDDQHIDEELFELFLSSNVYQKYADMFLQPEQCDSVDPSEFACSK